MILASLGKLAAAQALTAGTTDSTNVIQMAAADWAGITDVWLVIDTVVAAGGSGALTFDLVLSTEEALTTTVSVIRVHCASEADLRVATAGRHICAVNVGKMLKEIMETTGDTYYFVGLISTLSGSATITLDAALSPSEPQTLHHKMVTESGVTVPAIASAGSGA